MPRAGYLWSGCVLALFLLSVARSTDIATRAGQVGAIIGGILGPLLVASIVWLVVRLIRRRPMGYPAWVGLIAVGVGLVVTLAELGNRAREKEEATAALPECLPEATRYGAEPAGFDYTPLEGKDAQDVLSQLEFDGPGINDPHVVLAEGRGEDDVLLFVSVKRTGPDDDLDDYIVGAEGTGRPVRRQQIGGREAAWVENEDGSRIATAVKGCHFVLVMGTNELVRRVAAEVFEA